MCKIIILLADLSVALSKEHRLRMFKGRVLRRIFGSEREEVAGGLEKPA
jgi:hypothetical protein